MENPPVKTVPCEKCGMKAKLVVTPDDWEDCPASFTLTRECSGRCENTYTKMTPDQMVELTKRDKCGWAARR